MKDHSLNETIEQQLSWRYATKRFDANRIISEKDWATLEQSVLQAPTSFGLQPFRMINVARTPLREELKASSWNQPQVVEASHLVVFAAKSSLEESDVDGHISRIAQARGVTAADLAPYRGMMLSFISALKEKGDLEEWCTRQAYIGLGFLVSTAGLLNIDTCPLEGIEPNSYDTLLGLEELGLRSKVACALGYRSENDTAAAFKKVRLSADQLCLHR